MKLLAAAAAATLFVAPAFAQTGSGNPDSSRSMEEAPTTSGSVTDCAANPTAADCTTTGSMTKDNTSTTGNQMSPDPAQNSKSAGSSTAKSGEMGNGADTTAPAGGLVPGQTSN
ncbi:hypothetical protein J1C47_18505 [Jiella sp. MQZ13P-4]|uniref:Secreted protein n=2 Tax=Jiella sonneratiae TaxID=2816856 RepID=A0ABS3J7K0_9HYPH|nr:hypothetical protein [Jiella sonneratiae]